MAVKKATPAKTAAPAKPAAVKSAPSPEPKTEAKAAAKKVPHELDRELMTVPDAEEVMEAAAEQASDMQEMFRRVAETSLQQSQTFFDQFRDATDSTTLAMEESFASARDKAAQLNIRIIGSMKAGTDAMFDMATALAGAKDVSEAMSLYVEHTRKSFEQFGENAREISGLASEFTSEAAKPMKQFAEKNFPGQAA